MTRERFEKAAKKRAKLEEQWNPVAKAEVEEARKAYRRRCAICRTIFYLDVIKREYWSQHKLGKKWLCGSCAHSRNKKYVVQCIMIAEHVAKMPCNYTGLPDCKCAPCIARRVTKFDEANLV